MNRAALNRATMNRAALNPGHTSGNRGLTI
jgi:hypothetical protein